MSEAVQPPVTATRCLHVTTTSLPTPHGTFTAHCYRDQELGSDHLALVRGRPRADVEVPVRVHSECVTGEVFGSTRCDCGTQLADAMAYIARRELGVVVYLRGHEGRGIGLADKLRAYALQDGGVDTVAANLQLGLPVDSREYGMVPAILADLGVGPVELLTNSPHKEASLRGQGVDVRRLRRDDPHVHENNVRYLRTKRDLLGHDLTLGGHP